jgi:putative effector of murein hydrolase LrgA (UPF0299 family)
LRLLLSILLTLFLPIGAWTLHAAFTLSEPHYFVMFVFSGSLMILLGLSGVVGLIAKREPKDEQE